MAQPENRVLKPCDPTKVDDKDLPHFILTDGEARDQITGEFACIIHAGPETPLTVTGKLSMPMEEFVGRLRHQWKSNTIVKVSNVIRHAYGDFDDGSVTAWALGESGWFQIKPSKAYAETHKTSIEAVELYYFIVDQYEQQKHLSHTDLFRRYAGKKRTSTPTWRAAAQKFYIHRRFLVTEMRENKQSVNLTRTPIYKHFMEMFPELFDTSVKASSRAGSIRGGQRPSLQNVGFVTHGRTTRSVDMNAGTAPDNVSTTSSRKRDFTPVGPTREEIERRAHLLWKIIRDTYMKIHHDPTDLTLGTFATELHTGYIFDDVAQASDYICAFAPQLVIHMDKSRGCNWKGTEVYESLRSMKLPAVSRKRVLAISLEARSATEAERVRRLHAGEALEDDLRSPDSSDSDNDRPKSALRPKSSKFADKGAKRRGKYLRSSQNGIEGDDVEMDDAAVSPVQETRAPGRPGRPRKRKISDVNGPIDDGREHSSEAESLDEPVIQLPLRKRPEAPAPAPAAPSGRIPHSRRDQTIPERRNTRSQPQLPSPSATPQLAIRPVPSEEPNGPADTWICLEDGCKQKVYGASKELGNRLIREHIGEHEAEREASKERLPQAISVHEGALDLLLAEETMCNLPVNNLINRIRELVRQGGNPPAVPTPIAQRY